MAPISLTLPIDRVDHCNLPCSATSPVAVVSALWQSLESSQNSAPPPHKRRRLARQDTTVSDQHQICIADISILLADGPSAAPDHVSSSTAPLHATLHEPAPNRDQGWSLTLRHGPSTPHAARIRVHFTHDLGPEIDSHFGHLAKISEKKFASSPLSSRYSITKSVSGGSEQYTLSARIFWSSQSMPVRAHREASDALFDTYMSTEILEEQHDERISPQLFYNAVHVPDPLSKIADAVQHPVLTAELFPFQRRTVNWLLNREGVRIAENGSIEQIPDFQQSTPFSFQPSKDAYGNTTVASKFLGRVSHEVEDARSLNDFLRGGILAEEMGLGKTVEVISLLALNARRDGLGQTFHDAYTATDTVASAATLIITPPSILEQWRTEIAAHAPALKVFVYEHSHMNKPDIRETLLKQHVVLTTYRTLSSEIWHAEEKRDRGLRHQKKYEASKSPLMEILWWRVCLDEAQMVESGVSNAATVARRIPRCNAWAITGTPVRKDVQDLCGLLIFLRFEPFCEVDIWKRVIASQPTLFKEIFGRIALRHTKAQIRTELRLPPQKRITITIPFTAIEEQHYAEMFKEMCEDVGVDADGGPLSNYWDPDDSKTVEKMRTWLARLRQTCLHPEVGSSNRRALGRKAGPLRTVEEVLDVMMEQNETALRTEERAVLSAKLVQGHLYAFSKQGEKALALYSESLKASVLAVKDCRKQLADHERLKAEGKVTNDPIKAEEDDDDHEVSGDEQTSEKKDGLQAYRVRLRHALELQHACLFFVASAFYQMKEAYEADSDRFQELEAQESEFYEKAKRVRAEILGESAKRTKSLMLRIKANLERKPKPLTITHEPPVGGIESRIILEDYGFLKDMINDQSDVLVNFRQKLTQLLTTALLDQEDHVELTGDEYENTLRDQDESYVYLFILRGMLSDRHEMITGQANYLLQHEIKEASRAASDGQGHAPLLMRDVLKIRGLCRTDPDKPMSLRAIVSEIRTFLPGAAELRTERRPEVLMMEQQYEAISGVLNDQAKDCAQLHKELDSYRHTMNARLEYYRQLQTVSDQVKQFAEETTDEIDASKLAAEVKKEHFHGDRLANLRTKARFLQHLRETKDVTADSRRPCIICQSPFEIGVLTVCAHEFCKECIQMWMSQHRNCPMCKQTLRTKDLHEITYKPKTLEAEEEEAPAQSPTAERAENAIYTSVSRRVLDDIKTVDLPLSWGSKIDTLCRHLIYLRASDAGAKSIIFSQYRDFLQVLARALRACKIGFADIADKKGIQTFKDDPAAETFLLHAQAESSGLNLVHATHVLLCEPLVNTAIELQAVARVHRIGQRQSTTVWMYLVRDTIEESIYDISVTRRLEHVRASNERAHARGREVSSAPDDEEAERGLDMANSAALQSAPLSKLLDKAKTGGELVGKDDLWRCLFAKASRRTDETGGVRELEKSMGQDLRAAAAMNRRAR